MMRHICVLLVLFALPVFAQKNSVAPPAPAVSTSADSGSRLPVKRVVLYKNGVGYFEHSARVHGNQELNIDFTTAQLNDVLKSLTVVDLGEGKISGVRYNSIAPLDERLKALRLPFAERITRADYLAALRGSRVEVRSGSATSVGRLLSVESEQRTNDKTTYVATLFSIVTDSGEMRNFELGPSTSVRIAERDLSEEVGRYMNLVGSSRARDLRRMTISATGSGERNVFVSYISEVPVWKSTYRIILSDTPNEKSLLQGWAIVDNTVGEDWKDVQLALIAGSPQSFVQQISQPYYVPRPVVPLPASVMLTPQEHEGTMATGPTDFIVNGTAVETNSGTNAVGGLVGQFDRLGQSAKLQKPPATNLPIYGRSFVQLSQLAPGVANVEASIQPQANARDLGDYFEYSVKQAITIGKNQSALVPILQARIEAEKVTIWNENSREVRRALWLTNSSGLTLDAGTFNILDSSTFAGEGLIETVHPDERRLVSYAGDAAVRVTMEQSNYAKPYTHLRIANGIMIFTQEQRDNRKYTLHNSDTQPRQVVIEHPSRDGWKLAEGVKPEETTASFLRFRVSVAPGKTEDLKIEEYYPGESQYELSNLDDNQVKFISQQPITTAVREVLYRVLGQKNEVRRLQTQVTARQQEVGAITTDQNRVRENMKALKGSAEEKALLQRYTRQLDSQEDRLNALNKEIADIQDKQTKAQEQLDQMVQQITMDETF